MLKPFDLQALSIFLCIKVALVTDPCMGSGHILVYAFDVLMQIYLSVGYSERDAAKSIVENNLYGLDIDDRAAQLAYFALMMKARQYDSRFLTRSVQPHVYAIQESNALQPFERLSRQMRLDTLCLNTANDLIATYRDAKEYGSLLSPKINSLPDVPHLMRQLEEVSLTDLEIQSWYEKAARLLPQLARQTEVLQQRYDVVVTNPPYMGSSGMGAKMSEFLKKNYPDSKSDLFSAFIERGLDWIKPTGYNCMVTMQSWMFLSSFETMRKKLLSTRTITNLLHMENMVMGIAFGTAVANLYGQHIVDYKGQYNYMTMKDIEDDKPIIFPTSHKRNCTASTDNFAKIPGSPVAYWVSNKLLQTFEDGKPLVSLADPKQGLATADNNRFLRLWHEVASSCIGFACASIEDSVSSGKKWFPYNKGGEFRKWYGNNDYTVNWKNDGNEVRNFGDCTGYIRSRAQNTQYYFKPAVTWSKISSGSIAFRFKPEGHIFDVAGTSIFANPDLALYLLGFNNSVVALTIASVLSPTLNYEVGHIASFPIIEQQTDEVKSIVSQNINLSRTDWDSFETSWDFKRHPLISEALTFHYGEVGGFARIKATGLSGVTDHLLENVFEHWETTCNMRFNQLKANEEELNRIFIDIYGLSDELTPEVEDKDVTVRKANLNREIKSLISYAVGCMFGRYSLDTEGLAYAGGEWDNSKYITFIPDKDNVLPICDDEYFDDDIMGRFVDFVRVVYGAETLEENLKFIADALGGKSTPREVIRNYFLNDFYKDHCKIYKKRPIYWLFDSGKKNGFKSLVYLHRYQSDLLAKLRTDYVHEQQERYRTQLKMLEVSAQTAAPSERVKLNKQIAKLKDQALEIQKYEEQIHHLADQMIPIDLDDGVKVNYAKFKDVLAKI